MAENPTLQIPKDVIEPIIEAHISTAVATALRGQGNMIANAVTRVLQHPVDSDGKPTRYSSDMTFTQWLLTDAIKRMAKAALEEHMKQFEPELKEMIAKELSKRNSPMVKKLVESMAGALQLSNVRFNITVAPEIR